MFNTIQVAVYLSKLQLRHTHVVLPVKGFRHCRSNLRLSQTTSRKGGGGGGAEGCEINDEVPTLNSALADSV
jgi:hypothetical protein